MKRRVVERIMMFMDGVMVWDYYYEWVGKKERRREPDSPNRIYRWKLNSIPRRWVQQEKSLLLLLMWMPAAWRECNATASWKDRWKKEGMMKEELNRVLILLLIWFPTANQWKFLSSKFHGSKDKKIHRTILTYYFNWILIKFPPKHSMLKEGRPDLHWPMKKRNPSKVYL